MNTGVDRTGVLGFRLVVEIEPLAEIKREKILGYGALVCRGSLPTNTLKLSTKSFKEQPMRLLVL